MDRKDPAPLSSSAFAGRRRKRRANLAGNLPNSLLRVKFQWTEKTKTDTHTNTRTGSHTQCLCSSVVRSRDNSAIASDYLLTNKIQNGNINKKREPWPIQSAECNVRDICISVNIETTVVARAAQKKRTTFSLRQASTSFDSPLLSLSLSLAVSSARRPRCIQTRHIYICTHAQRYICHLFRDDSARKSTN